MFSAISKERSISKNYKKIGRYEFFFTQFRISSHHLAIERGRYKYIKAEHRMSRYCNTNETEDELHFLVKCPKYFNEGEKLFHMLIDLVGNLKAYQRKTNFYG